MKLKTTLLTGTMCLALGPAAFAQNFIINGGFETGDLTGWTTFNAPADSVAVYGALLTPPEGLYTVDLGQHGDVGHNTGSYIEQSFNITTPATPLTLKFAYGVEFDLSGSSSPMLEVQAFNSSGVHLNVSLNALHGGRSQPDPTSYDYTEYTFTPGAAGQLTIRFSNLSTTGIDPVLDNVTLTAVPEPAEYAAVAGLALVAFGAWRRTRR